MRRHRPRRLVACAQSLEQRRLLTLPAGMHGYEVVPNVIRADGIDTFRLEVDVNREVNGVTLKVAIIPGLLVAPADLTLRDDGLAGDRVSGDGIYTSGEFRYNTSQTFPTHYMNNTDSPSGIFAASVGQILIEETGGGISEFLLTPEVGLLRDDVPIVQPAWQDSDIAYTPHLINLQTSSHYVQTVMRQGGTLQPLANRLYEEFPDQIDFLMLLSTSKVEKTDRLASGNFTSGGHAKVKADYTGTGYPVRDSTANFGSDGRLMSMNLIDYMRRGLTTNNVTHEMVHQWNAYIDPSLGLSGDSYGHYSGRSSAGSLVGGYTWNANGDGSWTIDFSEGRSGGTSASEIELYMMGLIDASQVSPLMTYRDDIPFKSPSNPIVLPEEIATIVTIDDIIARHGPWAALDGTPQTDFKIAFLAESHQRMLTPAEMTYYEILAQFYTSPIDAGAPAPHLSNGWQSIDRYFGHGTTWSSVLPAPRIPLLIEHTNGSTTPSELAIDRFYLSLQKQPASDVVIDLASTDTAEVTLDLSSITFTPSNWNIPRQVRVTGVNDELVDGDKTVRLEFTINQALSDDDFDRYSPVHMDVVSQDRNFYLRIDDVAVAEGNPGEETRVTFSISPEISWTPFRVEYRIEDGTATTSDSDYFLPAMRRDATTTASIRDSNGDGAGDTLFDTSLSTRTGKAQGTDEYRVVEEFYIGDLSATELALAELTFQLSQAQGGGTGTQEFDIYYYAGNGTTELSDYSASATFVARAGYQSGSVAFHSLDLSSRIMALRAAGHQWLGIRVQPVGNAHWSFFNNSILTVKSPEVRSGILDFNGSASQTLTISIDLGPDTIFELDETFRLVLTAETSPLALLSEQFSTAQITILNDDAPAPDSTAPTSRINPLPFTATNKSFSVSASGSDPEIFGQVRSGIASYDIFVATDSGPFSYWTTVPAAAPSAIFSGTSNTFYSFRSTATDAAGNVEVKAIGSEAFIYVPDLDPPITQVTSVDSSTATFQIAMSGRDIGGASLSRFELYVVIDGGTPTKVGDLMPSGPDAQGDFTATAVYQATADGVQHSYRFYTLGVDSRGNVEAAPTGTSEDVLVTATFTPPPALDIAAFDVQRGANQRSYIRYLDILFNTDAGVQAVLDSLNDADSTNDRLSLKRFELDGSGLGNPVPLNGVIQRHGSALLFDFGVNSLAGDPNSSAGDGYYRLSIDLNNDGIADKLLHFYRLLGDTDGDGRVTQKDVQAIRKSTRLDLFNSDYDINGDGSIDALDLVLAREQVGSRLSGGLDLDD